MCKNASSRRNQRKFEHFGTPDDKRQIVLVFPASREIALPLCSGSGRADQPDSEQRRSWNVGECSIEKSEYSSTEFQGFVGLTPGKPISTMSQSYCRIAIAIALASGSNRRERHCEADPDCGRP
jgi:hypothetical protein